MYVLVWCTSMQEYFEEQTLFLQLDKTVVNAPCGGAFDVHFVRMRELRLRFYTGKLFTTRRNAQSGSVDGYRICAVFALEEFSLQ